MAAAIYVFSDDQHEYFCINALDCWEDFDTVSNSISSMEGLDRIGEPLNGPYSRFVDIEYSGVQFTLLYHDEIGVCLRIPNGSPEVDRTSLSALAEEVASAVSPSALPNQV